MTDAGNHDSFVHIIISLEFFASEMWSFFPNQTGIGLENESSKLYFFPNQTGIGLENESSKF